MLTESDVKQIVNVVYDVLKNENILQKETGQTRLNVNEPLIIEEGIQEYMKDKTIGVWLSKKELGKPFGIKTNQLYVYGNGKPKEVLRVLPLSFNELIDILEGYSNGKDISDCFTLCSEYNVSFSDIEFIIWAWKQGKCNYMLRYVKDDAYHSDFKKYIIKGKR